MKELSRLLALAISLSFAGGLMSAEAPSAMPADETILYTVKEGDTLGKIASRFSVGVGFIKKLNGLKSDVILVDQKLKIVPGPFHIVVEKARFRLTVYHDGRPYKSFKVGLGKNDSTPVGEYEVTSKLVNPTWRSPEGKLIPYPDAPLGTRWIGFRDEGGFGIHGTWEPKSIGKQWSHGCIRMLNRDVEEVFELVVVGKSKVTIKP